MNINVPRLFFLFLSVACRAESYYLLAKLYSEPNYRDKDKFEDMKWNVLNRTPKVHSTAIEEMRQEVEEIAKNWNTDYVEH